MLSQLHTTTMDLDVAVTCVVLAVHITTQEKVHLIV